MSDIYFINGQFLKLEDARISINDRGFQFGDGVYEVIRSYNGKVFHLEEHLKRFEKSASEIELPLPVSLNEIQRWIQEAFSRSQYPMAKIYIQMTRGLAERSHPFPVKIQPTFLITVLELHPLSPVLTQRGVEIITTEDLRWGRCDIKSLNLLPNVLAQQKAKKAGVYEALMIRNQRVTEGSISNFFMIKNDTLITAPLSHFILPGVTRDLVLSLARSLTFKVLERDIFVQELYQADEAFISGTTIEIVPVVKVDGKQIGNGIPAGMTQTLIKEFQALTLA
ncbi:MAG: D-amino-acid transaminase [Nitrospirae bacterium]|nr:D-amino-acid transaminase [Nitrospirota bacterium]MBI3352916.1 D-amino-acid transaminase [Nitrospirota bacterium]